MLGWSTLDQRGHGLDEPHAEGQQATDEHEGGGATTRHAGREAGAKVPYVDRRERHYEREETRREEGDIDEQQIVVSDGTQRVGRADVEEPCQRTCKQQRPF